ncbi:MAG: HPr family phosphocarrier protein [Oscillospiraceae bacterium]|nr:HPr family phosphocarrier protein [Oscillospiraceae bacterium]
MKELYIKAASFSDIRTVSELAAAENYTVTVTDGQRTVNAKSLMCIFSLDMDRPLLLQLDCNENDFESFREKVSGFTVH